MRGIRDWDEQDEIRWSEVKRNLELLHALTKEDVAWLEKYSLGTWSFFNEVLKNEAELIVKTTMVF